MAYKASARFLLGRIPPIDQQRCHPGGSPNDEQSDGRDDELAAERAAGDAAVSVVVEAPANPDLGSHATATSTAPGAWSWPAATRRPVAARAEEESKSGGLVLGKKTFMEPSDSVIKGREQRARAGIYLAPGASEQSLSYLDGTLAGDYGFDPLNLGADDGHSFVPTWVPTF